MTLVAWLRRQLSLDRSAFKTSRSRSDRATLCAVAAHIKTESAEALRVAWRSPRDGVAFHLSETFGDPTLE